MQTHASSGVEGPEERFKTRHGLFVCGDPGRPDNTPQHFPSCRPFSTFFRIFLSPSSTSLSPSHFSRRCPLLFPARGKSQSRGDFFYSFSATRLMTFVFPSDGRVVGKGERRIAELISSRRLSPDGPRRYEVRRRLVERKSKESEKNKGREGVGGG